MDSFRSTFHHTQLKVAGIPTSEKELKDLGKALIALSIAFAFILRDGINLSFDLVLVISAIAVGTGFLLHELAHKLVAQRYGCFAEFRSFDSMLIFAVLISLVGFLFAAPGAVMIAGPVGKSRNGKISVAGPVTNLILAVLFLPLLYVFTEGFWFYAASIGFFVNTWLALFNMIPFGPLDGAKVWRWNKPVFWAVVVIGIVLLFSRSIIATLIV